MTIRALNLDDAFQAHRLKPVGFAALIVLLLAAPAIAHPISVVAESAYVERGRLSIEAEVFAEDLFFFHDLKPNESGAVGKDDLRRAVVPHGRLLIDRLPVFDAAGRRVAGTVAGVTGDDFPDDILPGELMAHSLRYRLEYPLAAPPEFLSFSQRLVGPADGFPALVDLRVKQDGAQDDFAATLKPGQVRTVRFDWSGGKVEPQSDRETWIKAARDDALGATALNTVRSFLYVAAREVRHELLIPFPMLESYFDVDRADPDFLTPEEQAAAKTQTAEFFRDRNPITIDGEPRTPAVVTVDFFTLEDRNLKPQSKRRTVSAVNARVGVILTYPLDRPAMRVELVWDAFNREARRIDAFAFVGDEVLRPEFSAAKRKDTFEWVRPPALPPEPPPVVTLPPRPTWTLPLLPLLFGTAGTLSAVLLRRRQPAAAAGIAAATCVAVVGTWNSVRVSFDSPLAGPPAVTDGEAAAIARTLHANLYRAADAATDQEVVDALTAAADGEALRSFAGTLLRNLRSDGEEGDLAVTDVRVLSAERSREPPPTGFDEDVTWEVTSRLEHWGHVHDRRYRYDARLAVRPRDGRWLITKVDLRDVRIVDDTASETY